MKIDNQKVFVGYQRMIDSYLRMVILDEKYPKILREGMKYAIFPGGKRLRPLLCLLSYFASGGKSKKEVLPFAVALEMIHSFSLVHDDLPAIDNDATRRGKPTLHRVFGEGVAILIGDCLLNLAFETILHKITQSSKIKNQNYYRAGEAILAACGAMVSGQVMELTAKNSKLMYLQVIEKKTGALIVSSILVGAILAGLERKRLLILKKAADAFGLAFQLADDIKDGDGSVKYLGREKTEMLKRFYTERAVYYFKKLGERFEPFVDLMLGSEIL